MILQQLIRGRGSPFSSPKLLPKDLWLPRAGGTQPKLGMTDLGGAVPQRVRRQTVHHHRGDLMQGQVRAAVDDDAPHALAYWCAAVLGHVLVDQDVVWLAGKGDDLRADIRLP